MGPDDIRWPRGFTLRHEVVGGDGHGDGDFCWARRRLRAPGWLPTRGRATRIWARAMGSHTWRTRTSLRAPITSRSRPPVLTFRGSGRSREAASQVSGGADSTHRVAGSHPSDLLDFYGDDDLILDDYWRVAAGVSIGTTVTSYAICTKWSGLKYKSKSGPGLRHRRALPHRQVRPRADLGRRRKHLDHGQLRELDVPEEEGKQWKFSAFDTIGGIGGMNNYVVCARGQTFQIVKDNVNCPGGRKQRAPRRRVFPGSERGWRRGEVVGRSGHAQPPREPAL